MSLIAHYPTHADAELAAVRLGEHGIEATVIESGLFPGVEFVQLHVAEEQEARARELLAVDGLEGLEPEESYAQPLASGPLIEFAPAVERPPLFDLDRADEELLAKGRWWDYLHRRPGRFAVLALSLLVLVALLYLLMVGEVPDGICRKLRDLPFWEQARHPDYHP